MPFLFSPAVVRPAPLARAFAFVLSSAACSSSPDAGEAVREPAPSIPALGSVTEPQAWWAPWKAPGAVTEASEAAPAIRVIVTVDWEGRVLDDANLTVMEGFRQRHPSVPLTHFLNAAYFTKPGADGDAVEATMRRPLRPGDELGLHIHGWRRLFEAAGVPFRSSPSSWGDRPLAGDCRFDCGHEVPISAYTEDELVRVVRFSLDTLSAHGFGRATAFRAGGWVATPPVREALVENGIRYDHSAVPPSFVAGKLKGMRIYAWISELWPDTTKTSQPHAIAAGAGTIMEIPDNGALADYVSPAEMLSVVDAATRAAKARPGSEPVVSIGFHQETAASYSERVEAVLAELDARVAAGRLVVHYGDSRSVSEPR